MPVAAGTKIDGYEVLGLLGSGGMGEVYRARDPILKRDVAIKVLPAFVAKDSDRLQRFEQEAQAAAALNHPNILVIFRFGMFEGAPYLVSELLEGATLRQALERGPLPVRKAIDWGVQIAHGLAAANDKGIVHRDLKPENLFVSKDGRIKILDFGLAKLVERNPSGDETTMTHRTNPGKVMGTVGYMSPEQVRGAAVDHRADIFAFGAILYEMLTGRRAFQRSTSAETMTAILNEDPPSISQVAPVTPPGLQRVVQRCLEKSPEQRFQSASDLAFALESLSESGSFAPATAGGAAAAKRPPARLARWIGGGIVVAAMAVIAFFLISRSKKTPFAHYTIDRAMESEHVGETAISPDGNFLVATVGSADGGQSLVLHNIPTGSERTILDDPAFKYEAVTFSPDGNYIYFLLDALGSPTPDRTDVYRVPVLGGEPTRLLTNVGRPGHFGFLSFTDGGQHVCFYRQDTTAGTYQFVGANADGSNEHVLARGAAPFLSIDECSPDGRSAIVQRFLPGAQAKPGGVEVLDFASGTMKPLKVSIPTAKYLIDAKWTSDGKSLLATIAKQRAFELQIGIAAYPEGTLRDITNGLDSFHGLSQTADGRTIATTRRNSNSRFEEISLVNPFEEKEHQTGGYWFSWLDNGKVIESDNGNGLKIFDVKSNQTSIFLAPIDRIYLHPAVCAPGVLVVAGWEIDTQISNIYRIPLGGGEPIKLTNGKVDYFPECTADGKWLFFADNQDNSRPVLMRQPLAGGAAERVGPAGVWHSISPDGTMIAIAALGNDAPIRVLSTDSLKEIRSFPGSGASEFFAFSTDGKSIFYTTRKGTDSTIWRQPVDGSRAVKFKVLEGKSVYWLRPSPDGKRLGLLTAKPTSEAVLIRDTP